MWNILKFMEIDQNHNTTNNLYTHNETILILICVITGLIALIEFFIITFINKKKNGDK